MANPLKRPCADSDDIPMYVDVDIDSLSDIVPMCNIHQLHEIRNLYYQEEPDEFAHLLYEFTLVAVDYLNEYGGIVDEDVFIALTHNNINAVDWWKKRLGPSIHVTLDILDAANVSSIWTIMIDDFILLIKKLDFSLVSDTTFTIETDLSPMLITDLNDALFVMANTAAQCGRTALVKRLFDEFDWIKPAMLRMPMRSELIAHLIGQKYTPMCRLLSELLWDGCTSETTPQLDCLKLYIELNRDNLNTHDWMTIMHNCDSPSKLHYIFSVLPAETPLCVIAHVNIVFMIGMGHEDADLKRLITSVPKIEGLLYEVCMYDRKHPGNLPSAFNTWKDWYIDLVAVTYDRTSLKLLANSVLR